MSAADSRRVPKDQIDKVVAALYAAADRLDWEHLTANNRTAQYDDWVTDPEIGGVLTQYLSSENARSWIKDGPMKEYGRARLGAGRYAKFGTSVGPTAEQLVRHALGSDAVVVDNSTGVKPFHCLAKIDGPTTYMVWDAAKNLRHLVWAMINHLSSNPSHEGCIVILETLDHPVTGSEKAYHKRIAERCSITIKYYRVASRQPEWRRDVTRDPQITSRIMSAVRHTGTRPEMALRRELHKRGLRFRVSSNLLGKPDIVFGPSRVACFVDGDRWHGNGWRTRGYKSFEEEFEHANSDFWKKKISRNMQRDAEVTEALIADGWEVVRVWASDVERDLASTADRIEHAVRGRREGVAR